MRRVASISALLVTVAGMLIVTPAARATLLHDYELNGTFADSLGGPPMVGNGGTLGATGYTFAANQGPSLSNALPLPGSYSIEIGFTLNSTAGYKKLIDFKDLTSDNGLYNHDTELVFYDLAFGPDGAIEAGVPVTVLLTRNGTTGEVVGYVNGIEQIRFTDSGGDAVFTGANNIIHFMQDDGVTGGSESPSGFLDFVRISTGPTGVNTPALDPGGFAVAALLLLAFGVRALRHNRSKT